MRYDPLAMTAATDTLRTADTLRDAGVPERQAQAHARAIEDGCSGAVSGLVTRADLRADLANLERRLVLWAVGVALTVGAAAVSVLARLLG